ncbi:hypothetical protein Tco_0843782 [Tanacetum coccineum]
MIVDIEDDIMDPVMQCTTLPSHSSFSQKKLVSFVTEIHISYALSWKPCQGDSLNLPDHRLGLEEALRLQEQLDEKERQRIARVHEEASTFNAEEWDNIQA